MSDLAFSHYFLSKASVKEEFSGNKLSFSYNDIQLKDGTTIDSINGSINVVESIIKCKPVFRNLTIGSVHFPGKEQESTGVRPTPEIFKMLNYLDVSEYSILDICVMNNCTNKTFGRIYGRSLDGNLLMRDAKTGSVIRLNDGYLIAETSEVNLIEEISISDHFDNSPIPLTIREIGEISAVWNIENGYASASMGDAMLAINDRPFKVSNLTIRETLDGLSGDFDLNYFGQHSVVFNSSDKIKLNSKGNIDLSFLTSIFPHLSNSNYIMALNGIFSYAAQVEIGRKSVIVHATINHTEASNIGYPLPYEKSDSPIYFDMEYFIGENKAKLTAIYRGLKVGVLIKGNHLVALGVSSEEQDVQLEEGDVLILGQYDVIEKDWWLDSLPRKSDISESGFPKKVVVDLMAKKLISDSLRIENMNVSLRRGFLDVKGDNIELINSGRKQNLEIAPIINELKIRANEMTVYGKNFNNSTISLKRVDGEKFNGLSSSKYGDFDLSYDFILSTGTGDVSVGKDSLYLRNESLFDGTTVSSSLKFNIYSENVLRDVSGSGAVIVKRISEENMDKLANLFDVLNIESMIVIKKDPVVFEDVIMSFDISGGFVKFKKVKLQHERLNLVVTPKIDILKSILRIKGHVVIPVTKQLTTISLLGGASAPLAAGLYFFDKILGEDLNKNFKKSIDITIPLE